MRLVLGGMNQGQKKVALELTKLTEDRVIYCKECSFEDILKAPIINDFHLYIKRVLKDGGDPYDYAKQLIEGNPQACVVMDEIGCGVVPDNAFDRDYRETVGRIGCILAENSREVYRVFCGIPTRIK